MAWVAADPKQWLRTLFYSIWIVALSYVLFIDIRADFAYQEVGFFSIGWREVFSWAMNAAFLALVILQLRRKSFWRWLLLLLLAVYCLAVVFIFWGADSYFLDIASFLAVVNLVWIIWIRDKWSKKSISS